MYIHNAHVLLYAYNYISSIRIILHYSMLYQTGGQRGLHRGHLSVQLARGYTILCCNMI